MDVFLTTMNDACGPKGRDFDIKLNENNFNGHTEPRLRTLAKNKHKKANIALEERYI